MATGVKALSIWMKETESLLQFHQPIMAFVSSNRDWKSEGPGRETYVK